MRHDFFQVNLGYYAVIVATAIQGRQDLNQWVTSYTLKYGNDGIRFRNYQSGRAGVRFSIFCSLYYYMRNFCNLIGLEQWYLSLFEKPTCENFKPFAGSSINK